MVTIAGRPPGPPLLRLRVRRRGVRHARQRRRGVTYVTTGEGKRGPGKQPVMALVPLDRDDADVRFVPVWPEETAAR
ncbi:MAG: hypothetical protein HY728_04945 [Candidatus Rokubacteria bacterium]|nr:hypothetical protein [Candidatus Rokubacteria bacterium]